jgi:hypothetical protein
MAWGDPEQWPTVAEVMGLLAMSRAEVGSLARAGRWGFRDVWPGAACPRRRGGCPAVRLKAKAVAKVLRGFAKKHPGLSADAENMARYLSAICKM